MRRLAFASTFLAALATLGQADLIGISDYFQSQPTVYSGLYDVSPTTGAATRYADVTSAAGAGFVNPSLSGAAYLDGKIYVCDFVNDGSGHDFGYVDQTTGVYTGIGDENGSVNWWSLAADPAAHALFATDHEGNANDHSLYVVDPATGDVSTIGKTTSNGVEMNVETIGYDSTHSVLYGWNGSSLYSVDTTTAEATFIGDNGFAGVGNGWDMTYDPSRDTMYANDGSNQKLYTVDLSTGQLTFVGDNLSGSGHINAMTYAPVPEPASLLALGLGGAALLRRRRRA